MSERFRGYVMDVATGGGCPSGGHLIAVGVLRSRSWPLFDRGRAQADGLGDAGRARIGQAGVRIEPAQVGLVVELRQRIAECPGAGSAASDAALSSDRLLASRTFLGSAERSAHRRSRWRCRAGAWGRVSPHGQSSLRGCCSRLIVPPTGLSALAPTLHLGRTAS